MSVRHIPEATVGRLPQYLRVLQQLADDDVDTVASEQLAELAGVNAAKVRKDLSYLGTHGTRGVGYEVDNLRMEIAARLGLADSAGVAVVGLGNLGRALAGHSGFRARGFPVVALYDVDPAKVGSSHVGITIEHLDRLGAPGGPEIGIGVIATPAAVAQLVADRLVAAGVRSILTFAPAPLHVPADVTVRTVDLALELQVLSYYRHLDDRPAGVTAATAASA